MKHLSTAYRFIPVVALALLTATACGAAQGGPPSPSTSDPQALAGFELAKSSSCFGCHKVGGKGGTSGPAFDMEGEQVKLANGSTVNFDDTYLRTAITEPDAQIAAGYHSGIMSSAVEKSKFSPEQLDQLVAYLKAVRKP